MENGESILRQFNDFKFTPPIGTFQRVCNVRQNIKIKHVLWATSKISFW